MAEKKQQKRRSKVVDSWKLKSWYNIKAPAIFEGKEIGQLVATDESSLKDRKIKLGLGELTGSFSQQGAFTSVVLRVTDVSAKTVNTKFIGHELSPSYLKTLLRRRRSIIYSVDDVTSKDGVKIRIKSVAVTAFRVSESIRYDLRKAISENIHALAAEMDFNSLAQEVLFGKFAAKVFSKIKNITPMRRLEIRKSELAENFE
jgi:small subunit ribosomal protein S3Ae